MKGTDANTTIVVFKELVLCPELQTIGISAKFHINYPSSCDAGHWLLALTYG